MVQSLILNQVQRSWHPPQTVKDICLVTLQWVTLSIHHKSCNKDQLTLEHMVQECTSAMLQVSNNFHPVTLRKIKDRSSANLEEVEAFSKETTSTTTDQWNKANKINRRFKSKSNNSRNSKWDRLEETQRPSFKGLPATLLRTIPTHIWAQARLFSLQVKVLLSSNSMTISRRSCSQNTRKCRRRAANQIKWSSKAPLAIVPTSNKCLNSKCKTTSVRKINNKLNKLCKTAQMPSIQPFLNLMEMDQTERQTWIIQLRLLT